MHRIEVDKMKEYLLAIVMLFGLFFAHPATALENSSVDMSQLRLVDTAIETQVWLGNDMIATAPLGMTLQDALEQPELIEECYELYNQGFISHLKLGAYNLSIPFKTNEMSQTILGTIPF